MSIGPQDKTTEPGELARSATPGQAYRLLFRPLPDARINGYVAVGSLVLALAALYYTGRTFEAQRRDSVLFELAAKHDAYDKLILATECLERRTSETSISELDGLKRLSSTIRSILDKKRDATLSEMLESRDSTLTTGISLTAAISRHNLSLRERMQLAALEESNAMCAAP